MLRIKNKAQRNRAIQRILAEMRRKLEAEDNESLEEIERSLKEGAR
jgi:hypothetical protein